MLCNLPGTREHTYKQCLVAERDIAKDVSNLAIWRQSFIYFTELIQAGKNDDLPIGARILEELHTVDG